MTSVSKTFFSGSNRNYGRHMIIHNGQFAECEVVENFQGLCGPRTRMWLVNWSSRTRTFLEDYNIAEMYNFIHSFAVMRTKVLSHEVTPLW